MLVNWWVEKINVFYSTFTNVFFIFVTFFLHFLTFLFFLEGFFTSMVWDRRSYKDENGLRPKIQSWSWSWSYTCGLGLGLAGVMLCCGARRHNDLEGHSKFSSTIYSFLFCAWNITTVTVAFAYLKVKPAKCFILPVVLVLVLLLWFWSWSQEFGIVDITA